MNVKNVMEQMIAIKSAAKAAQDVYTHHFKEPFEYDGKKYDKLDFYFNKITGKDIVSVECEMQLCGETVTTSEFSKTFQSYVAARAANVAVDFIQSLPYKDFGQVVTQTYFFLLTSLDD